MSDTQIPIVVGVTGHRDLRPQDRQPLYERALEQLRALREKHPHTPVTVLSSLAEGADQLCAQAALQAGCSLVVPLPMDKEAYRRDFSSEGLALFRELCKRAQRVFVVDAEESVPQNAPRGFYYRQAGIYVATHCHILLALWDGVDKSTPEGGGTSETVGFMLEGGWQRVAGQHAVQPGAAYFKTPQEGVVWHISVARAGKEPPQGELFALRVLGGSESAGQWPACLAQTERFNRDALLHRSAVSQHGSRAEAELFGGAAPALGEYPQRLLALFAAADRLALHYRDLRRRSLGWLSGLGTLLVLVFLLYDELESDLMLPIYALLLLAAGAVYLIAKWGDYHEKYIHYRLLAEALRVQLYWQLAGVGARVWEQYTWAQKDDIVWVKEALAALDTEAPQKDAPLENAIPLLQAAWIEGQLSYHRAALVAKRRRIARNGRISACLLALTVLLFALTFALEFFFKDAALTVIPTGRIAGPLMMHEGQDITVRGIVKILLGIVAAGTALLSNYFSKLSLPVQSRDHERMAGLYGMARERLAKLDPAADRAAALMLLQHLGREAVVENGNWLLDSLEQQPDIVI